MPGRLVEHSSREGGMLLEKERSLDGGSDVSPVSPPVSSAQPAGIDLNVASPDNLEEVRNSDVGNGDLAAPSADPVPQDSAFTSSNGNGIAFNGNGKACKQSPPAEGRTSNGGSEVGLQEQAALTNAVIEGKFSRFQSSPQHTQTAHDSKEGNVVQVISTSLKSNPKRKPALSPRLHTRPKELEKDKPLSPKSAGRAIEPGKERAPPPKLRSPAASALKGKDFVNGKVESFSLSPAAVTKDAEKERINSLEEGGSLVQDSPKPKDKTRVLSLTAPCKRLSVLPVKALENSSPLENAKHMATSKDKERAFPNSPISPNRFSTKATPVSPLRALQITPISVSEKAPFSTSKLSPGRPALRLRGPDSPAKANKLSEKKMVLEKVFSDHENNPSDGEKMNHKVKNLLQRRKSGVGSRKFGDNESVASSEQASILIKENPNMGPFLLKLARQAIMSGDNPQKALDYASRAAKSYETAADGKPSLDLVMSLHVLAATHCILGQFEAAIPVLQQSIAVTDIEGGGQDHALAAFAGNMQLGDTYSLLGRGDDALAAYHVGLEVQKKALGEMDPHVGETCRYLAEAHTQAMQFDKAEELCQHALNIHKEHSAPASIEEATDRRLMGLICNGKGDHEAALEHLVLASMALIANAKDVDVASVDSSIGNTYASLGRFDEAVFSYQKALTVFKASKGENHVAVASVYASLAELYLKTGKFRECRTYCDSALRIYNKQGVGSLDEVASGLTELAVVYEALNEQEQALFLLKKALGMLDTAPGQQSSIAGVEAQIGVLSYMCGNYVDARSSLSKAVSKLRGSAEKTSALFGIVLNQMGLCCLHLSDIKMAVQLFEESRSVLESACGPHHPDTLTVYSNLAGAYDALGRLDDAIGALQYVVEVREEQLGTANSEVEDERSRLAELLREAGRLRSRRLNNTLGLLMHPKTKPSALAMPVHAVASATVSVNG